ncbi:MAG TPA: bifunctional diguanylate cyclase/phosphodiesterase [Candidatus Evtepia faecigallinarum]|nr:bifunctional diguanylate cyclase/phosphodiesterase [Candidatus Evtepia faecigallinarum]
MSTQNIIYVAGNPEAYPLEYYDRQTQSYEGVIPQLLAEFAAQSDCQVIYYQPEAGDQRARLGEHSQVDLLSGYAPEEEAPAHTQVVEVPVSAEGQEGAVCLLYLTEAAPEGLAEELTEFFRGLTQQRLTTLLLESAAEQPQAPALPWLTGALALAVAVLVCTLVLLVRRHRRQLEALDQKTRRDPLTGLNNLEGLAGQYRQFVHNKLRVLYTLFCFSIDLDRLEQAAGEEETAAFLRFCAVTLSGQAADTDLLAKVSPRAFVLLRLTGDRESPSAWLSPLLSRLRAYPREQGLSFGVDIHVGIYPLQEDDWDLNKMIFSAIQAAALAQREERDYVVCSQDVLGRFDREHQLQADIGRGFARREFQLYIQGYVDARTGRLVGGEALARWNHPQRGLLLPKDFVPLMEREKTIEQLDYYCLQEACALLESLVHGGEEGFFLSCNISRETLSALDCPDRIAELLAVYDFPRELLILELAEGAQLAQGEVLGQNILALKDLGLRVILDDFGTGFPSFHDLQHFPLDGLKLDKALVDTIGTPKGRAVAGAMIQVGHDLGMTVIAAGVEEDSQAEILRQLRCDVLQGYRFYYPLPVWEAKALLLPEREATPPPDRPLAGTAAGEAGERGELRHG